MAPGGSSQSASERLLSARSTLLPRSRRRRGTAPQNFPRRSGPASTRFANGGLRARLLPAADDEDDAAPLSLERGRVAARRARASPRSRRPRVADEKRRPDGRELACGAPTGCACYICAGIMARSSLSLGCFLLVRPLSFFPLAVSFGSASIFR